MGRRAYLFSALLIFGLPFMVIVLPYVVAYYGFYRGDKGLVKGASIGYEGVLDYTLADSEYSFRFSLDIKYINYTSIIVNLKIYDYDTGVLIFNDSINASTASPLIEFLLPSKPSLVIEEADTRIVVCGEKSRIYFGPGAMPSDIGVPATFPAMLDASGLRIANNDWGELEECAKLADKGFIIGFYEYLRLEKRYMLLLYEGTVSTQAIALDNATLAALFGEGPPLMRILVSTFSLDLLEGLVKTSKPPYGDALFIEKISLAYTSVYPIEQDWLGGIMGTYMYQTPFSQALTISGVVLLILYFRRR